MLRRGPSRLRKGPKLAELKTRIESEEDYKERLAELSDRVRAELIALLGNPPDPRNVPDSFWREVRIAIKAAIFVILYETFINAARIHGMSVDDAVTSARRFATARAAKVAEAFVKHTREMLARIGRKWDAHIASIRSNGAKQELSQAEVRNQIRAYVDDTLESDVEAIIGETRDARIVQHEFSVAQSEGSEQAVQDFEANTGIVLERWWRHSDIRPRHHSNAGHEPCEVCSDLEGTQAPRPGDLWPGRAHVCCDCFVEYIDPITGNKWGSNGFATWEPSRDSSRENGSFG